MNYNQTLDYLYNQLPVFQRDGASAYKPGLERSIALDKIFNHPHQSYKTIHVGGTNGKGSTSSTLAAILQSAGYKVGLYTSPHLVDFRERIRVNGEMIDKSYITEFVNNHKTDFEPLQCSFFELTMMMALCYFRTQEVDVAIIEVGLGGLLDSTNIISPELSIITNISLDHTQFLGKTEQEIATQKAGIIKPNVSTVIGYANNQVKQIFIDKAEEVGASIFFAWENPYFKKVSFSNGVTILEDDKNNSLVFGLGGLAQKENANTIMCAIQQLKLLNFTISNGAIEKGFRDVVKLSGLLGRWQIIQNEPTVICDTAHNIAGITYNVEQLKMMEYSKLHIIIGFANDKDISAIMSILPKDATYYFVNASINRALKADVLYHIAKDYNLQGEPYSSIEDAYRAALTDSNSSDIIFIGGSNFVVGEFLEKLEFYR